MRAYSEYSVGDGACRVAGEGSAAARAAEIGMPALAITDAGNIFGALKFYEEARRAGVKPIIGCEAETGGGRLILLCANGEGYINLSRLLTLAYREGNGKIPDGALSRESAAGLIALSGGPRGPFAASLMRGEEARAEEEAEKLAAVFCESFYLEIWQSGGGENGGNGNNALAARTAHLAKRLNLPAVAAHPVQCARREDLEMLNARRCVANNWKLNDHPPPLAEDPWLLSPEEMRRRFARFPGAVENAAEIARRCNFAFQTGKAHLPRIGEEGGNNKNKKTKSAREQLRQSAEEGLQTRLRRVADGEHKKYRDRLAHELRVIDETGFNDYFLIVADFVCWAKNNDVPVGPGRGSGAGSLVAYALDITTLDPIAHGLFFERFLNSQRVSPPDFDIDFCARGRDKVIHYVAEKYGGERVSQIVTFGTFGARGGLRDMGRVIGANLGYCDRLARMIPPDADMTIARALQESEKLRAEAESNGEAARILDLAKKVEGTPRNIGTHAGGVLIAPRPIPEFCPLYAADDGGGALVSQFDMKDIEKAGLLKFDFLGLRTLTVLDHAEKHLHKSGEVPEGFSLEDLPLDDARVFRLYSEGETTGVFQCESSGMRRLMRELKPTKFEEITALMALYRPGPLGARMAEKFVLRKNGMEEVQYPHEAAAGALGETYGVIVYQEQVMQIARQIAGYSLNEADLLRRAIGKKDSAEAEAQRARFMEGAKKTMSAGAAAKLFEQILSFARYGFNKAHAAAYALLSYRTAYLKIRHPAAFLAAAMSAEADSTDRMKLYAREAKRMGLELLPPDINKSRRDFLAAGEKKVRYGLGAIRGLGEGAIEEVEKARGDLPFADIFDLCRRLSFGRMANQAALRNVVCAGALDSLHSDRAAAVAALPSAWAESGEESAMLFGEKVMRAVGGNGKTKWTQRKKLMEEQQALGFCLSASLYSLHARELHDCGLRPARLADLPQGANVLAAGVYNGARASEGMRSRGMEILKIEDDSGEAEALVDSRLLKAAARPPQKHDLLIVEGTVRENFAGETEINARRLWDLDSYLGARARLLRLFYRGENGGGDGEEGARELSSMLSAARAENGNGNGGCEVRVFCGGGDPCQISLGGGFRVSANLCDKLRGVGGVEDVRVECAGESA